MADERVRPGADDIYENVKRDAAEELERPVAALAFSGLFAGATLGFSGLASAGATSLLGGAAGAELLGALVYPIGFVAAIIGRAQLFTENTLYPMTLVFDERRYVRATLRLWAVVWLANVVGALAFAALAVDSGAVSHGIVAGVVDLGEKMAAGSWSSNLWSGLVAGWLLALVAWTIEATDQASGQIVLIWVLTALIAIGSFDHCVSTTAEVLAAVVQGTVSVGHFFGWLAAVTLGNVIGGVAIVGVLNYGQVRAGES
ncbi:MAG: Formate/nitrite family of transporter [Solirubrobacterales bacterium]|nr:Formate/nitrite family of transporter [Solirubrobacterales bacterium]